MGGKAQSEQRVEQLGQAGSRLAGDAEDGNKMSLGDGFDDVALELFVGRRLPFEVVHRRFFIDFDDRFDQRRADRLGIHHGAVGAWRADAAHRPRL